MTDECIIDGAIPDFGRGTFCIEESGQSAVKCDATHKRAAKCDLVDYGLYENNPIYPYSSSPDPPGAEFQQRFTNSGLGSFLRFDADYCPTYVAPSSFSYDNNGVPTGPRYIDCVRSDTAPNDAYSFESFGSEDSTCFNTIGEIDRPLCLSMQCMESGGDVTIAVSVGAIEIAICESAGQLIDVPELDVDVKIECPRPEILCPEYVLSYQNAIWFRYLCAH